MRRDLSRVFSAKDVLSFSYITTKAADMTHSSSNGGYKYLVEANKANNHYMAD